jgi:hypothetical protein
LQMCGIIGLLLANENEFVRTKIPVAVPMALSCVA